MMHNYQNYRQLLQGLCGLEIGGPSRFFSAQGTLPVYKDIAGLDNCNFSSHTIWEGQITAGMTFRFDGRRGRQYICEGTNLHSIAAEHYDFVLSCGTLEHIANPFKALKEWLRVTKKGGIILLVLPRKESNFDHRRAVTTFDHLLLDEHNDTQEDDLTHLSEILRLHDLSLDPPAGTYGQFFARSLQNSENRALHHHVFDLELLRQMFAHLQIKTIQADSTYTDYIIAGRKQHG